MSIPFVTDDRFNPFTEAETAVSITGETHRVPDAAPFHVQLNEIPRQAEGVTISGFTEVTTAPAAGQFRVDYTYKTGLIEFNAADTNTAVSVDYTGLGTPLISAFMRDLVRRHPAGGIKPEVWAYENVADHFNFSRTVRIRTPPLFDGGGGRDDRWTWSTSVADTSPPTNDPTAISSLVRVVPEEGHFVQIWARRSSNVQSSPGPNFLVSHTHYPGQNAGPVNISARFSVRTQDSNPPYDFAVGIGSWNGSFPPHGTGGGGPSFISGALWKPGTNPDTIKLDINNGAVVFDNIPTSFGEFREYTISFTPGLVRALIDKIVVATTSTFVNSYESNRLILMSDGGEAVNLLLDDKWGALEVDWVTMTVIHSGVYIPPP